MNTWGRLRMRKRMKFIGISSLFLLFVFMSESGGLAAQKVMSLEESACQLLDKGEIDEAVKLLQKVLEANPDNLNAQLYLGIALYLKKDVEGATERFEKVEKEVDRMVGASRPFGDEAMFTQMGMDRKAELLFSKERKGLLYFCRGLTLKEKKDWKDAEKKFKEALKHNYDEKAVRLQLFHVSMKKKDIDSASEQFSELKKIDGEEEVLTFLDGYLKYREGKLEEALAAFQKLAPENFSAKKNAALLYYNSGDYAEAAEIWEEIISKKPDDKSAQINMGRALFHLGDSAKAQEYFNKAGITLSPENFSPKKIPLDYEDVLKDVKFNLMCQVK